MLTKLLYLKQFYYAMQKKFILVHNHPSESAVASRLDIKVTAIIMKNAKLLNVELLDHIIIEGNKYESCMNEISFK